MSVEKLIADADRIMPGIAKRVALIEAMTPNIEGLATMAKQAREIGARITIDVPAATLHAFRRDLVDYDLGWMYRTRGEYVVEMFDLDDGAGPLVILRPIVPDPGLQGEGR